MKNKKVGKSSKKYFDIPLNKSSKIVLFISSIFVIIFAILIMLTFYIPELSKIFWLNIRNPINDNLFHLYQYFPFITNNYMFIFITIIIGAGGVVIYLNYIKVSKNKYKNLFKVANVFYKILSIVILLALFQILMTLSDYNHANINTFYLNEYTNASYNEDDLFNLLEELSDLTLKEAKLLNRIDDTVNIDKEILEKISRKDLLNISDEYPFLKGRYPTKIKNISNSSSVYGFTNNYSISTDKSINNVNYLSVITHEYCHFKGILHESDAVYCAYLAGINSNNLMSRYSSHLEAFSWVSSIAEQIDEDKTNKIVEEILNLCLNDNYREVCDLQVKNINRYQNNSNIINLKSYLLSSYKNLLDEYISILDIYVNEYNAVLLIDDNQVSLIDIRNYIVSGEEKTLQVLIKNDAKSFNNVKEFLKSSNRFFKSIRQQNTNYKYEVEDIDYYLKAFSNNSNLLFNDKLYNDYAYPRIVRLLLEHRSLYGIK